jgi:hypothetical protein
VTGEGVYKMVQDWLMIKLHMELGNDTLQQNIDAEIVWKLFDTRSLFPNVLGHFDNSTHLIIE